ncbi:hypothetical protein B0H14DRAFT_3139816 [Mycena olivaceomarginata]|nr:hypothetical protein B0H14DRAFT_3139816 [Mycena olivaceomarginata]
MALSRTITPWSAALPCLAGPRELDGREPILESPLPSYDMFFCSWDNLRSSWDTFRTMHPLLSILDPREWAGIVSSYVDGWWQTGYERWVLRLAHRRYPNGTFTFSPPNTCSPVDPMGHSCARGMDNNVGFLNAALADAAAAFPAPHRRQHELRHQRLARQQEAAPPLAALIPLLSLPTLPQEECDEVLAIRGYGAPPPGGGYGGGGGYRGPRRGTVRAGMRAGLRRLGAYPQLWNWFSSTGKDPARSPRLSSRGKKLHDALAQFGYNLGPHLLVLVQKKSDVKAGTTPAGHGAAPPGISFDRFVRALCGREAVERGRGETFRRIQLKWSWAAVGMGCRGVSCRVVSWRTSWTLMIRAALRRVVMRMRWRAKVTCYMMVSFGRLDTDRDGWIQINYDQFMETVLGFP